MTHASTISRGFALAGSPVDSGCGAGRVREALPATYSADAVPAKSAPEMGSNVAAGESEISGAVAISGCGDDVTNLLDSGGK